MIAPEDRQAAVTEYFEKDAGFWDSLYDQNDVFSVIHRERSARAISEIKRLPLMIGAPVLEVGCGAGLLACTLAARGFMVEATDSTPAMIELTRRNAQRAGVTPRLRASIADVHRLDYSDAKFELVVAMGVLPWLHSPRQAIEEMSRVLQPGGFLLANTDNRARLTHLLDPLFNPILQPVRRGLGRGRSDTAAATSVWSRRFNRELKAASLRRQRSFTLGFGPFTFMGRQTVRGRAAVALHEKLQRLADERLPLLRSTGCQYVVVAQKT